MLTAEADIRTEHAARYLARLCGHAGKMGTAGRHLGHRPAVPCARRRRTRGAARGMLRDRGDRQPELGPVDHAGLPRPAAVRAEAADEESLRQIQDLLTARLQKFGRREHLTVDWQDGRG